MAMAVIVQVQYPPTPRAILLRCTPTNLIHPCRKFKSTRARLLELVSKHSSNFDDVSATFTEYLSLVRGLVDAPGEMGGESKLRHTEVFRWTNSLGGRVPR